MARPNVTFCGTHSTGKTTMIKEFFKPEGLYTSLIFSSTRELKEKGFPINTGEADNYNLTQIICGNKDFENMIMSKDSTLFDRSLLDTLVYSDHLYSLGKVDSWVVAMQVKLFEQVKHKFGMYFLFMPDFPLVEDGTRQSDEEFRKSIHNNFLKWIQFFQVPFVKVQGTHEQRMQTINQVLNKIQRYGQI